MVTERAAAWFEFYHVHIFEDDIGTRRSGKKLKHKDGNRGSLGERSGLGG